MKAYLKFNFPDDEEEFDDAKNASKVKMAIDELDQILRNKYKYESKYFVSIEYIRNALGGILYASEFNMPNPSDENFM